MSPTGFDDKRRNLIRQGKPGFTLVELIVVLVILAILAALLIPALTGYIDKAKARAIVAETRHAVMAAQTLLSESYGMGRLALEREDIKELSEVPGTVSFYEHKNGQLEHLIYNNGQEYCTYCRAASDGSRCPSCGASTLYTVEGRLPDAYVTSLMATVPQLEIENLTGNNNTTLFNYFKNHNSIDSTTVNGKNFPKIREALAQAGFDTMSGAWSIIKGPNGYTNDEYNYRIYYTSEDISKMPVGSKVTVIIYDPSGIAGDKSGQPGVYYYTAESTIKEYTLTEGGVSGTYNVLSQVSLNNATPLTVNN